MRTIALINSRAGSVGLDGPQRMRSALGGVGLDRAEIVEFDHRRADEQLRKIQEEAPDLVIVWGGDGTHRSVLDTLGRHSSQILLLPGGTMNLLTKWLHDGRAWEHVLWSVLGSPTPRILPAGRVDDMLFFCAMIAGVPAQLATAREDVRRGDLGRAIHDTGTALSGVHTLHLAATYGKDPGHPEGHFPTGNVVGALVGPLARSGRMDVAWHSLESAWSALEFAWTSFASDWRDRPGMSIRAADSLLVENVDGLDIPTMIDGEQIPPRASLSISFVEEAATCLVAGSTS